MTCGGTVVGVWASKGTEFDIIDTTSTTAIDWSHPPLHWPFTRRKDTLCDITQSDM